MTKGNAIRYYRLYSGADYYLLGFIYKKNLYYIKLKEIMPRYLIMSTRGKDEILRLRLINKYREELIKQGAIKIGNQSLLLSDDFNRGWQFERIIYEMVGLPFKGMDNKRFDKGGDLCYNGIEYQIKLENASMVRVSTLHRIQEEKRKERKKNKMKKFKNST